MKCSDADCFRTVVPVGKSAFELVPDKSILMLGSCFTDNIGARFVDSMWNVAVNPCGVLYNPASIAEILSMAINKIRISESDLVEVGNRKLSWMFDSHFSSVDTRMALKKMNDALTTTYDYLKSAQTLIITFGTAWIYELKDCRKEGCRIVANCHKFPASLFHRRRMTADEIFSIWRKLIEDVVKINTEVKIIFTVSPIRHFKDGAFENTLSKAALLTAVERLTDEFANAEYFPAYEIVMDDLRDYRFYESDMLHPSAVAVDYIWQRFVQCYLSDNSAELLREASKLSSRLHHRHITDDKDAICEFEDRTQRLLSDFKSAHPYLNVPSVCKCESQAIAPASSCLT